MRADRWHDIRAFLEAEHKAGTFPGAGLVVSQKGKRVLEFTIGTQVTPTRRDAPVTLATRHPAYSFSKLVTATVLGIVFQDAKLDGDAPVSRYLPEFGTKGKEKVTLRHCLTHAAGIPNASLTPVDTEAGWQAFLAQLCGLTPEWEPGSKAAYHAVTGHFLAAACACRQLGKPWEVLCQERLLRPLGLKRVSFALPQASEALSLTPQPKDLPASMAAFFPFAGHPAGGCWGTLPDLLAILELHNQQGLWKGKRLIPLEVWRELHTVQYPGKRATHDAWGLGFLLRGTEAPTGSHSWFGFQNQSSPSVFGHAGIDTFIGVGDPASGVALVFATTHSPQPAEKTVALRNGVTDRVFAALRGL